ncbi:MAG TPA: hypothetical protein PK886_01045 [Candidatus Paceibacterota bacterium]|nr:hypothetical protein [Candidatus Paceibacterota bacterium]
MENFEFRKDEDGFWNKNIDSKNLHEAKLDIKEHVEKQEFKNNLDFKRKGHIFKNIEEVDEKELETITELRLMIDMMKNDPTADPEVLKKMEEELVEEKQKREILEPRILEKEDDASFALQKKKNLLN